MLKLPKKVAIEFIESAYSEVLAGRGALVHLSGLGRCLFIGRAA